MEKKHARRAEAARPFGAIRFRYLHHCSRTQGAWREASLGTSVHDLSDPMGKMFFTVPATFAEFEVNLIRMRTKKGMVATCAKAQMQEQKLPDWQAGKTASHVRCRRALDQRPPQGLRCLVSDRLSCQISSTPSVSAAWRNARPAVASGRP